MGQLSHIEDVEQRNAAREQEQMLEAQQALAGTRVSREQTACAEPEQDESAGDSLRAAGKGAQEDMSARDEMEFHGLSSVESMGIGQKFLIVLAIIVVIAAILYVLNSWFHFV